jgi:hypothetical protein
MLWSHSVCCPMEVGVPSTWCTLYLTYAETLALVSCLWQDFWDFQQSKTPWRNSYVSSLSVVIKVVCDWISFLCRSPGSVHSVTDKSFITYRTTGSTTRIYYKLKCDSWVFWEVLNTRLETLMIWLAKERIGKQKKQRCCWILPGFCLIKNMCKCWKCKINLLLMWYIS